MGKVNKKLKIEKIENFKVNIRNLEINVVTKQNREKNLKLENLQRKLHLKLQGRYRDLRALRETAHIQEMRINKMKAIYDKLRSNLIQHFHSEFKNRDDKIIQLENELH